VLGTRNYTSIAVLTGIDGLFVHLVPNICDYRLPQLRFLPQLMDFLQFLTSIDGLFAREVEKCPPAGLGKGMVRLG